MPVEHCPSLVSRETIYATIYAHPRGALKQGLIQALRQAKTTRGRRRPSAAGRASFVPEPLRIIHRPEDVNIGRCPATGKATSSRTPSTARVRR